MATRLRKTRRLRGGRHMGWGQVAQHRSFGHKGGLGRSGHLKHLASTVIKEDQDHFGHEGTHSPHPSITKVWVNVRDLNDLFSKSGKSENSKNVFIKLKSILTFYKAVCRVVSIFSIAPISKKTFNTLVIDCI